MAQHEDIKQKINQGLSDRQIAKSLGKRRSTVSEIKKGLFCFQEQEKFPDWMNLVEWEEVLKEIALKICRWENISSQVYSKIYF